MNTKLKKLIDEIDNIEKYFTISKGPFFGYKTIYNNECFNKWVKELSEELNNYSSDNNVINESITKVKNILNKRWNGFNDKKHFKELKLAIAKLTDII